MNLVHASDSPASARREIDLYFKPNELCSSAPTLTPGSAPKTKGRAIFRH